MYAPIIKWHLAIKPDSYFPYFIQLAIVLFLRHRTRTYLHRATCRYGTHSRNKSIAIHRFYLDVDRLLSPTLLTNIALVLKRLTRGSVIPTMHAARQLGAIQAQIRQSEHHSRLISLWFRLSTIFTEHSLPQLQGATR